jgi:hypothetical protein
MVVFLCFCWLLLLYTAGYATAKNKDIFSPTRLITAIFILRHLPFILYIAFNPSAFNSKILTVCNTGLDDAFIKYTFTETLAYLSLIWGIYAFSAKRTVEALAPRSMPNYKGLKICAAALFAIGFGSYAVFLFRIGGLGYLLTHLSERVLLQQGQYILYFTQLLYLVPLLLLYCIKLNGKTVDKMLVAISVVACMFVHGSLGGREPVVLFLISLLVGYHYIIGPLQWSKKLLLPSFAAVLLLIAYVFIVPLLRRDTLHSYENGGVAKYVSAKTFVYQTSYVYIDVFACNYFNKDNAWYFKGFFDPVKAYGIKGDKGTIPQVDQGVYFSSIVSRQQYYAPPVPRKELLARSWPTENFGFAYANFLLPGIVLFFFLQGGVFALAYRWLRRQPYNAAAIVLYVLIVFVFNFSSLRLAGFLRTFPLFFICYVFFNRFAFIKKQR